ARCFESLIAFTSTLAKPGGERTGETRIADIRTIPAPQKEKILTQLNATGTDYPKEKTIQQLFGEQTEQTPDAVAVVGNEAVTYKELDERSGYLAAVLMEKGVQAGSIVGIMSKSSTETITGILAILKAGGGYLPIDPGYPEERIDFMLRDSGANILLDHGMLKDIPGKGEHKIRPCQSNHAATSGNFAYIIYTSGSTGKPKGVIVEHCNVVRLVKNTDYIQFNRGERILQTGALEFDASTFEIWGALLNGLQLFLMEKEELLSPGKLRNAVTNYDITTMWMTAPLFNQVSAEEIDVFSGLKNLLVGGDVLSPVHIYRVKERFPGLNIINGYGPTENTTFSTTFRIERNDYHQIPIGKPVANSTAYIVDRDNNLQPISVAGELLVGGDGVARGYLNRPRLTAERFITVNQLSMSNLYRTGDLARWLPDGNIEFLGRMDTQVKVRGFRVE
ncbi:MAG: amino acid adenylation domain-containing protein, partial [bacterium]|nr:amino acid adenylation domain-containing protein [bacterium]